MKPKGSIIKRWKCPKQHAHGNKCPATWWARVIHVDPETGKTHDLSRRAESRAAAIDKRDKLIAEIEASAGSKRYHYRFSQLRPKGPQRKCGPLGFPHPGFKCKL